MQSQLTNFVASVLAGFLERLQGVFEVVVSAEVNNLLLDLHGVFAADGFEIALVGLGANTC